MKTNPITKLLKRKGRKKEVKFFFFENVIMFQLLREKNPIFEKHYYFSVCSPVLFKQKKKKERKKELNKVNMSW